MDNLTQAIRDFVLENYCFNQGRTLADEDSFMERGIIDSTGILELISFVEGKYSIELDASELIPENLDSIGRLARFVCKKLGQPRQSVDLRAGTGRCAQRKQTNKGPSTTEQESDEGETSTVVG